ncbi:MAG: omega-amidase [Colwellia sp.]
MLCADNNQQKIITTKLDFSKLDEFRHKFPAFLDADEFELS